ncbi:MAG TPA: hypothetical protein VN709_05505 [Terriglobales bacterium]|nr:hypothetical protein [Terriglobales bacterium]
MSREQWFGGATLVLAAIAIGGGFWLLGSPRYQRKVARDNQLAASLQNVEARISIEYRKQQKLPGRIDEFKNPITDKPFEYQRLDESRYQLCADFETDSFKDPSVYSYSRESFERHSAGHYCQTINLGLER